MSIIQVLEVNEAGELQYNSWTEVEMADFTPLERETVEIWNRNADFWDERMGEGNAFHKFLIEPTQLGLLVLKAGERVLDIGCGNGQFARKMASLGCEVMAVDAAPRMIENARRRTAAHAEYAERLRYDVADASDEEAMLALGESEFDAAVCTMALMDIASIEPVARAVRRLLKADGRFVFSVMHPCFNSTEGFTQIMERDEAGGELVERLSVRVTRYIEPHAHKGLAMVGQPVPQNYFHRPLSTLLGVFFKAGYVVDGLEEPVFPKNVPGDDRFGWLMYKDIPPALSVRLRRG